MQWKYINDQPVLSSGKETKGGCTYSTRCDPSAENIVFIDFDSTVFVGGNRFQGVDPQPMEENICAIRAFTKKLDAQVIIVTNQGWTNVSPCEILLRLNNGARYLVGAGINIIGIYCSPGPDFYKKPLPGMARLALYSYAGSEKPALYMIGDAAGREGDHSDADIKFARNIGAMFYTPEKLKNPDLEETYPAPFDWSRHFKNLRGKPQIQPVFQYEVMILCGLQGSGKTFLAKSLENAAAAAKISCVRVSGDETRGKYSLALKKAIATRPRLVICDRTHYSPEQRAEVIEIARAQSYSVHLVRLAEPLELTKHKMTCRGLMGGMFINPRWWKPIQEPDLAEGIDRIDNITPMIDSSLSNAFNRFFALEM